MMANVDPQIIKMKLQTVIQSLGKRSRVDPLIAKYACIALQKLSLSKEGVTEKENEGEKVYNIFVLMQIRNSYDQVPLQSRCVRETRKFSYCDLYSCLGMVFWSRTGAHCHFHDLRKSRYFCCENYQKTELENFSSQLPGLPFTN